MNMRFSLPTFPNFPKPLKEVRETFLSFSKNKLEGVGGKRLFFRCLSCGSSDKRLGSLKHVVGSSILGSCAWKFIIWRETTLKYTLDPQKISLRNCARKIPWKKKGWQRNWGEWAKKPNEYLTPKLLIAIKPDVHYFFFCQWDAHH